ncbi:MAG: PqqD family protein [Clostridia bacterium]|nr:PqqD family protein [Clostridia bacterium]
MKIKNDFVLEQIAGTWVVLPRGDRLNDFTGMLTLNESGRLLWARLTAGCTRADLIQLLIDEYKISYDVAETDMNEYLATLAQAGCLDDVPLE